MWNGLSIHSLPLLHNLRFQAMQDCVVTAKKGDFMPYITTDEITSNPEYKALCDTACYSARLYVEYYKDVYQEVCIKAMRGELYFDEARGVRKSKYLYRVFRNSAVDYKRKLHYKKEIRINEIRILPNNNRPKDDDENDKFIEMAGATPDVYAYPKKDAQFVMREALNRLVVESDERTVTLLVRYALLNENREALADEYQMLPNNVCVLKSRWWPRLVGLGKEVMREDLAGKLKVSPNRLGFLKPYLKWI